MIVSQSPAWAFWPRRDPIGKVVALPGGKAEVVGVVKDVDPERFGGSENPVLYRAWRLDPTRNMMSVRFDAGAAGDAAAVRAVIRKMDPNPGQYPGLHPKTEIRKLETLFIEW